MMNEEQKQVVNEDVKSIDDKDKLKNYSVVIKLQSYDHKVLDASATSMVETIKSNSMDIFGPIPFPTKRIKFVTRRAPNIYKVSFEKFEYRVHCRVIYIKNINSIEKLRFLGQIAIPQVINIKINFLKK